MIRVQVRKENHTVVEVTISGHADSTTEMMDLVCAEVSAIGVGALNSIDILCPGTCDFKMNKGYIQIHVNQSSESLQTILKMLEIQLETVEYTNKDYIQVEKVEV